MPPSRTARTLGVSPRRIEPRVSALNRYRPLVEIESCANAAKRTPSSTKRGGSNESFHSDAASIRRDAAQGWLEWVGGSGAVRVERFGASAPGHENLEHYGLTVEHVMATATQL